VDPPLYLKIIYDVCATSTKTRFHHYLRVSVQWTTVCKLQYRHRKSLTVKEIRSCFLWVSPCRLEDGGQGESRLLETAKFHARSHPSLFTEEIRCGAENLGKTRPGSCQRQTGCIRCSGLSEFDDPSCSVPPSPLHGPPLRQTGFLDLKSVWNFGNRGHFCATRAFDSRDSGRPSSSTTTARQRQVSSCVRRPQLYCYCVRGLIVLLNYFRPEEILPLSGTVSFL
jgi:hypothetical protein